MTRQQAIVALIDGLFCALTAGLTLWLDPAQLQFALAVCALVQPLVVAIVLHFAIVQAVDRIKVFMVTVGSGGRDGNHSALR